MLVPVAVNVGVIPGTRLLLASLSVIVIVDSEVPSGFVGPVPVIVEFNAIAAPAVKTTNPPDFTTGVAMERVFVSAFVDLRVQVDTPLAFPVEQVPYTFVVPVLVPVNVGI